MFPGIIRQAPTKRSIGPAFGAIEAALETMHLAAEAKQIPTSNFSEETGPISGDPDRLQQVIWNCCPTQ